MRWLLTFALVAFIAAAVPTIAYAAPQSPSVVIVFHAQAHDTKAAPCGDAANFAKDTQCDQYTVTWPLGQGADVYLVAVDFVGLDGIAGLSCGIDYDNTLGSGVDVYGWTLCADAESPITGPNGAWPAAQSGNRITWDAGTNCQVSPSPSLFEAHGVAGAFYVYAYGDDHFRAIANANAPGGSELYVKDCDNVQWDMQYFQLGEVVFTDGSTFPFHPCPFPDPVERKSWGSLKALYQD